MSTEQLDLPTTDKSAGESLGCLALALLCIGLIVVGLVEVIPVLAFTGLALAVAGVVWVFVSDAAEKEQRSTAFDQLCKKHDMAYRAELSSSRRDLHIAVSHDSEIVMMHSASGTLKVRVRQILSVDLMVDDRTVYESGSVLPGAVVGGLALGGAGAIVGALATSRGRTKDEIRRISLRLRVDDVNRPLVTLDFLSSPTAWDAAQSQVEAAEQWTALIEVLRHRLAPAEGRD